MFDPCAQSANMFHPEDWNLIKSTQHTQIVAMVAYRWIFCLHWQTVDVMVVLLNVDRTLDSRLAAILQGNGEGYGDSSYDTMNYCFTLLALHSYKWDQQLTHGAQLNCDWGVIFLRGYTYYCWKLHWHCRTALCVAGMAEWDMEQCQRQPLYQKQNLKEEEEKQILQKPLKTKVGRGKKKNPIGFNHQLYIFNSSPSTQTWFRTGIGIEKFLWETGIRGPKRSPNVAALAACATRLDRTVHF